jgi:hypothetical protein
VRGVGRPGHLIRRFFGSLSNRPPGVADREEVARVLSVGEFALWSTMQGRDQRHSVIVWRRFTEFLPASDAEEQRAALLHDLGKAVDPIGPVRRTVATLFGPVTSRLRRYLDHEAIGVAMLAEVSSDRTLSVLRMEDGDPAGAALRRADDL